MIAASLIVLVCSVCPRVFLAWRTDQAALVKSIPDACTYLSPAENLIKQGAFLDSNGNPEVTRTPGYPAFLAVIMFLVGQGLRMALIAQSLVLSFGVLALYWLARRILPPVMAFTGGLMACFSPWGAVLAGLPLSDGMFLVLLVVIFFTVKLIEGADSRSAAVLGGACVGLLAGAIVLVKPVWPLVILIAVVLLLRYGPRRKRVWLLLTVMLICACTPLFLWTTRNQHKRHFDGLSDIQGKTAWRYLASRVKAQANGQDRFTLKNTAMEEDQKWGLSIQEADKERWRRAKAVFREHPLLTICCFVLSAAEHAIHPSPDVLIWGRLNFYADSLALGLLWVGLLLFAYFGWRCDPDPEWDDGTINRSFLTAALAVCLVLTLGSGISFGAGARLRAPLEMIVPLLAAVGVVRFVRAFRSVHRATLPQRERQVNNRSSPILAVLMPVYNEAHTVEAVIKKILAAPVDMEIRLYIVDDCSTDASSKVIQRLAAQDLRVTVLHHPVNRGKGAAIRTAIANAQGDFVIIQDADLEYDPTDYPRILAPLLRGDADAVFGSRYLYNVKRYIYGFWHTLANATLTTLFNVAHNVHLTDMETCYKAMPLRLLKSLRLTSDRFGFEVEITSRLVALKSRIVEVPIAYHPRDYRSGKKIGWRDGLEALYLIIKFRFFNTIPSDDAELVGQIAMSKAPRYHKWFAAKIGPFLGRRVLDAGAGIGNLSIHIAEKHKLFLVEPRKECLKLLETNIGYRDDVAVSNVDLFSEEGVQWAKAVEPDSVLCIDKLDRINDEAEALSRLAVLLPRGGTLIVRAAANNSLYGKLDQSLGLRRRYEMRELVELVSAAGFIVIHQRQYGKLDALMWFFRSRIFRHEKLGRGYLAALNLVTPFLGIMEDVIPGKNNFVVVVGKKAT